MPGRQRSPGKWRIDAGAPTVQQPRGPKLSDRGVRRLNSPSAPNADDLIAELQERVAEKKQAGLYSLDGLAVAGSAIEPFHAEELAELVVAAEITPDLRLAQSTKRGVGAVVGKTKSGLARATSQPLANVADQATAFNVALLGYVSALSQEVAALRSDLDRIRQGQPGA